jgi:phosphoribulokinase
MIKFRPQRGSYQEAMQESVVIDRNEFFSFIWKQFGQGEIEFVPSLWIDDRNGWDTHTVVVDGKAVGFTDGPL